MIGAAAESIEGSSKLKNRTHGAWHTLHLTSEVWNGEELAQKDFASAASREKRMAFCLISSHIGYTGSNDATRPHIGV